MYKRQGFTDTFLVFDLPFIFETVEQARAVMDSEIGTEILNSVEDQGIKGLAWFENGFRNVTNNVKPINSPDDLKGIKIRTMENQIQDVYKRQTHVSAGRPNDSNKFDLR